MTEKLHPLSIAYRGVGTAWNLLGFAIVLSVSGAFVGDGPTGLLLVGVAVPLALIGAVGWELLYYRRFEYELTEDTFDLRSGVLSRRNREIPYRRIQNVAISRNVIQRLLGIAEVSLETAGGSDAEARLRYVSHGEAERLQNELSRRKRQRRETGDADAEEADTEADAAPDVEELFAITERELAVLGLVSIDLRILSMVSVAVPLFGPTMVRRLFLGPQFVVAPLAAVLLYVLSALASGILAVANYYGFRLVRTGDELRYERGLIHRYSGTIPIAKVQTQTISENALQRLAGYASLTIETAGYSPGEAGGSQSAVPIAQRDRVERLARSVEDFGRPSFERPPKRARERYAVRYLGVLALLVAAAYGADALLAFDVPWYALLAGLPVVPVAAHLKWSHLGYALGEDHVVTREGFWNRRTKVVPYHRVQTVFDSQTIFQRRRRLATVTVDTAGSQGLVGNDPRAVDVDVETARELREEIGDRLQASLAGRTAPEDRLVRDDELAGGPTDDSPTLSPGE